MKSVYAKIVEAGIEFSNHYSDLYVPDTAEVREILKDYEFKSNITRFRNAITGEQWIDIPFAYEPYWEKRI